MFSTKIKSGCSSVILPMQLKFSFFILKLISVSPCISIIFPPTPVTVTPEGWIFLFCFLNNFGFMIEMFDPVSMIALIGLAWKHMRIGILKFWLHNEHNKICSFFWYFLVVLGGGYPLPVLSFFLVPAFLCVVVVILFTIFAKFICSRWAHISDCR